MKLRSVQIRNFRAIGALAVPLDPALTVLHGNNAHGKTSLLAAIAVGLGAIPTLLGRPGGINFLRTDHRREAEETAVRLETIDGQIWERLGTRRGALVKSAASAARGGLRDYLAGLSEAGKATPDNITIPVFAFYDTNRAVFDIPERRRNFRRAFSRFDTYIDALARKTSFKALVEWFYTQENAELRRQRESGSFAVRDPALDAVRRAISTMMPDVTDPHIEHPTRFVVRRVAADGREEKLALEQLSDGYRIVLALVADLALRMAIANPHLPDPLRAEAIVLIDEVDLHLHPEWQQRILGDLPRAFPNAQLIVSTHSPQVITTVAPEHVLHLTADADGIAVAVETGPTFGARAGDVLEAVMGVGQRPRNDFSERLADYRSIVGAGDGESETGRRLRAELDRLSPDDPALAGADVEIRRRKVMREVAEGR